VSISFLLIVFKKNERNRRGGKIMKLSTKGRYAVTAMMEVALKANKGPITLADISVTQGISNSYLEQLFSQLRRHGLVKGVRGPRGGYSLAKDITEITIADIISAVDDKTKAVNADAVAEASTTKAPSLTDEMWQRLSAQLYEFLSGLTLADYVEQSNVTSITPNTTQGLPQQHH
jgi:Rrf2 family iron-sulfur cluster assembly transcriptional regulator